jgi:hypothetical protein
MHACMPACSVIVAAGRFHGDLDLAVAGGGRFWSAHGLGRPPPDLLARWSAAKLGEAARGHAPSCRRPFWLAWVPAPMGEASPARLGAYAAVLLGLMAKRLQSMGSGRKPNLASARQATVTPWAPQTSLEASLLNLVLLRPHAGF